MSFRRTNNSNERGQAVLIVLLSLSVVLIIVLYIMSRSITDISLSSKEEDSMRAFSAAEAGIERALVIGSDIGNTTIGSANFSADVSSFGFGKNNTLYPLSLKSGDAATFWFTRPAETGFAGNQFKLCWGAESTPASNAEAPAIELTVYYRTTLGEYRVARTTLDPNVARRTSNNFASATTALCTVDDERLAFQSTISFLPAGLNIANYGTQGVLQFATAKILYNTSVGHKIGIDTSVSTNGSTLLPSQGVIVDSQGSAGESNRRIEVYQLNSEVPPVFMNSIYSTSSITK